MTEEIIKCVKGESCIHCGSTYCRFVDEVNELKQENSRLKKEIRLYDCIDKWGTKQCRCACRCLGNEFCEDADKRVNKYKSALEGIREIAEKYKDMEGCRIPLGAIKMTVDEVLNEKEL